MSVKHLNFGSKVLSWETIWFALPCHWSEFFLQNLQRNISQLKLVLVAFLSMHCSLALVGRSGVNVSLRINKVKTTSCILQQPAHLHPQCELEKWYFAIFSSTATRISCFKRYYFKNKHSGKKRFFDYRIKWRLDQMLPESNRNLIKCRLDHLLLDQMLWRCFKVTFYS